MRRRGQVAPVLYATYNDKRWGLPPMTGSKADLAIATRLLSASDADRFRFLLPRSRFAEVRGVGRGITRRPGAADGLLKARLCLLVPSSCITVVVSAMLDCFVLVARVLRGNKNKNKCEGILESTVLN